MLPQWLSEELYFDQTGFLPLCVGASRIGWLRPERAAQLARWPEVFELRDDTVAFAAGLTDAESRSAALAGVLQRLREEGLITGWRDEQYAARNAQTGEELFRFERAARKHFGLTGPAVHLNGLVRRAGGLAMWIATRSDSKAIEPGKFDNMVAGGIGAGLDEAATLVKECAEEAGIPEALARQAVLKGAIEIARAVPEGMDAQRITAYELFLPEDFQPRNQDGEVARFELLAADEVLRRISEPGCFTVDAALVTWECLARHGLA